MQSTLFVGHLNAFNLMKLNSTILILVHEFLSPSLSYTRQSKQVASHTHEVTNNSLISLIRTNHRDDSCCMKSEGATTPERRQADTFCS
ncbi:hypothetical protein M378DRAFT_163585 [Amanita muscaria Koide BX008]|uniref:Uncharacterized protein n=1 Tax=Amanita muscaria (strain Koide BX008) TaxID=946122 RepID=A0A0C2X5W3_AMAMK|nr:hypothetical protein M378DRAFT_163585 [Amanita muscaria Koide BX008]